MWDCVWKWSLVVCMKMWLVLEWRGGCWTDWLEYSITYLLVVTVVHTKHRFMNIVHQTFSALWKITSLIVFNVSWQSTFGSHVNISQFNQLDDWLFCIGIDISVLTDFSHPHLAFSSHPTSNWIQCIVWSDDILHCMMRIGAFWNCAQILSVGFCARPHIKHFITSVFSRP